MVHVLGVMRRGRFFLFTLFTPSCEGSLDGSRGRERRQQDRSANCESWFHRTSPRCPSLGRPSFIILPRVEQRNLMAVVLREVNLRNCKMQPRKRKSESARTNMQKRKMLQLRQTPLSAAPQVAMEESVNYCLLGDSPVTMGKSLRWLQSSHEPSYIFAS